MRAVLLAAVLVALAVSVRAETITRCGASSGQAWYFAGPLVPQGEAGWTKDALSEGELLLIVDGDNKPDIIVTDMAGTRSSRADGAHVMFVAGTKSGFKLVLLVYVGTVEHFLFQLDRAGNGTVAWGTVRGAGLLQKSSMLVAKCRAP